MTTPSAPSKDAFGDIFLMRSHPSWHRRGGCASRKYCRRPPLIAQTGWSLHHTLALERSNFLSRQSQNLPENVLVVLPQLRAASPHLRRGLRQDERRRFVFVGLKLRMLQRYPLFPVSELRT